mgnify:CR=1 FL=1
MQIGARRRRLLVQFIDVACGVADQREAGVVVQLRGDDLRRRGNRKACRLVAELVDHCGFCRLDLGCGLLFTTLDRFLGRLFRIFANTLGGGFRRLQDRFRRWN